MKINKISTVAIGSQNPVKINCTKKAFFLYLSKVKFEFVSVSVPSGVNNQPMSDEESILGAENRAKRAIKVAHTDYGVGIEGGIMKVRRKYFCRAWVVVVSKKGVVGLGSSLSAPLPQKYMSLITKGVELGKANDMISGKENTKQENGYFGFISDNLITREKGYTDAVIMALSRFKKPKVFEK